MSTRLETKKTENAFPAFIAARGVVTFVLVYGIYDS
jgi:hypothetical protein